ncbi:flagellar biosynthetic protein FliR [Aeoliella sp. ICT_H6.2]|uniref:Flagellar biosynthetic protein FliR n=1 Tax=Aeoliella straminimaris TaxID=2954799 RepID=A0A9X2FDZ2_9BACT|nr:flagellar biosynthetic protein FliR [Aeoliella straminimaris]MCO6047342.1 flagellar biosynthetic protein FliR [Aeoliella straminimaris]
MEWLEAMLLTKVAVFALVLARIGALVATAPLFKLETVPITVRGLLAVTLSILVMPLYAHLSYTSPWNLLAFGSLLFNEILIGAMLGLGMQILFAGVQLTGQIIAHMSGMSLAEISSPDFDAGTSVFTQIFHYTTMAVFVAMGGHRMVMAALLDTFEWAPPGRAMLGDSFAQMMVGILQQSFELGIRASAPVLIALFLSTLLLGLITRTLPQINVLAVGFGLNAMITIAALLITIGGAAWLFQEPIVATLEQLQSAVVPVSAEVGG